MSCSYTYTYILIRVQEEVKCLETALSEEKSCRETIEKAARY